MEPSRAGPAVVPGKPLRVMLVDDMPQVRQELCQLLPLLGNIEVVGQASDGAAAIGLAEALQPDVVLMDLVMPGMDGWHAAPLIRVRCPRCRIIALTIHAGAAERQQALQAGMADLVVKGAPLEVLLGAIWGPAANGERPAGESTQTPM